MPMNAKPTPHSPPSPDPAAAMDRMYRYTRHVYDASRKFYLLGRDRLLRDLDVRPGDRVVEIGCGTARNLIQLARRPDIRADPSIRLYGLDASEQMLVTARQHIEAAGLSDRIHVRQGLAERLSPALFADTNEPDPAFDRFDVTFFSYSLSMIPTWRDAVDAAMRHTAADRPVYSVDFWDQAELPAAFRFVLKRWLALFHVHHRPELLDYLRTAAPEHHRRLELTSVGGRYAYIAALSPASTA